MKKTITLFFLVLFFIVGAVLILAPNTQPLPSDKPIVAATIYPTYSMLEQIAGNALEVKLILPAGASPHTFEASPSLLREIEPAKALYMIGHGIDIWAEDIAKSADIQTVQLDNNISLREYIHEEHEETDHDHEDDAHEHEEDADNHEEDEHDHEHEGYDPHYWLSFKNALIMTETIENDLTMRFPEHANTFAENAQTYRQELMRAQEEAERIIEQETERKGIVTLHEAWYYFTSDLNLELVGSFEPNPGQEPSPQQLIALNELVKEAGVSVIYTEPQISTSSLSSFLQDNDLNIATLDPIGDDSVGGYINMMLLNVQTIADNQ